MPRPAEPVAGAFEGEDVGVVDDVVDHGSGDGLVAEHAPQPENWTQVDRRPMRISA